MIGDSDGFVVERDRIKNELVELNKRRASLDEEQADIARKAETTTGDTATMAQLKIETEQVAEAKSQNDRLIDQATKRLKEVENTIFMQKQSDII
jgi:hypothetical protein